MSRYPHEFAVERRNPAGDGLWHECRCGAVLGRVPGGDDCPAALRERVEELEQHVGSLHKATRRGMDFERDLIVARLRQRAEERTDDSLHADLDAIERGEHLEGE